MNVTKESELEINNKDQEINNDDGDQRKDYNSRKNKSFLTTPPSSSSSSSSCSDEPCAEEITNNTAEEDQTETTKKPNNKNEPRDYLRCRSKSDGGQSLQPPTEPFEVFPSLPLDVLEKMELIGSDLKDRLSEDEIEQKFVSLSLAFKIDTTTIKDRCERQRHYRDQTETNLATEIERLIEKITLIQPLCVNLQTTELLNSLLEQADVIMYASNHATISAERYGAVQFEERLSESVNLMISYVDTLKHQRDSARRYLQYTKKVLQESHANSNANDSGKQRPLPINGKSMTKRRASIATISEPRDLTSTKVLHETKKIIRRTSDYALKSSSSARTFRPSRLELGVDLVKIKEGVVDETPNATKHEDVIPEEEVKEDETEHLSDVQDSSPSSKLLSHLQRLSGKIEAKYREWTDDNTLHEFFYIGAIVCFTLGLIVIFNTFIEIKCTKATDNPSASGLCKFSTYPFVKTNND